ncbi:exodeoxyribonuclease V subunit beta [Alteromonas halophila]|uniref:RecBCD enzyme subunit RecB n=1 Tax=Alteromonas halophila TaxID=516698 RepID=A0A918MZH2_9ALTE|nr:exodeoxyribonuclease V subunit beta [Alteromonas halophila]GGW89725.1 RecBCD enzyme subunit RecB [Alteromonas halophila]
MTQTSHLNVAELPLWGRHLIEASAGTGKTFNITRLYLRLMLEKSLSVQQILVMTFTKAATEEIRGRLAVTLSDAVAYWETRLDGGTPEEQDPVYSALYASGDPARSLTMLKAAQLEMDEAAVFTIHGFCQHVLNLLSFESGAAMQLTLETDTAELYRQAAQDWIRAVSHDDNAYALLAAQGWHVPSQLLDTFGHAMRGHLTPQVPDPATIEQDASRQQDSLSAQFAERFHNLRTALLDNEATILTTLVTNHKDQAVRSEEWAILINYLSEAVAITPPPAAKQFINGNRYRGKDEIKALFAPLKELFEDVSKAHGKILKARDEALEQGPAMTLIADAFSYIRAHVQRHKTQRNLIDFDDLIRQLAEQATNADSVVAETLRQRFPAALIDEFQDTDAAQYAIVDAVYPKGEGREVLMMIGDPKQAIYGFRGGDIFTYLKAGREADHRWVMDTNWRSVADMVSAYNRLFHGAPVSEPAADVFGYGIDYQQVKATSGAKAAATPLSDSDNDRAAMTYLQLIPEDDITKAQMQQMLSCWVGQEIHRLFQDAKLGERAVLPSDIAILVRSATEAGIMQRALQDVGLGAVFLSNKRSLFGSMQAEDCFRVLDGIWHADSASTLNACLASPLLGFTHQQVVDLLHQDDDILWDELMELVALLRQMWLQRGCMSVILYLMQHRYQPGSKDVERELTNYLHLAEVLGREAAAHARPDQLLLWLHRQLAEPQQADELIQRLESDDTLIQIVTQHGSKGLEYPIVFIPFGNDYRDPAKAGNKAAQQFQYFDHDKGELVLQLGRSFDAVSRVQAEGDAEAMRLLYVAVTRAAHRCYIGMAPFSEHQRSPLARALGYTGSGADDMQDAVANMVAEGHHHSAQITFSASDATVRGRITPHQTQQPALSTFGGSVDDAWRLYSFSMLARQQTGGKQTVRDAEALDAPLLVPSATDHDSTPAFRFTFEKGARAGNLLHDILELADFQQPDWQTAMAGPATRFGLSDEAFAPLNQWLDDVLAAPLTSTGSLTLKSLPEQATLREAEFYFPVEGLSQRRLHALLASHRSSLASLCDPVPVTDVGQRALEGMMHGFIDLIFESEGRYYVADYKSTWLGDTYADYLPASLCQNNQQHLYDLQYLIYSLALHRYLQQTLPEYDPEHHFGGVYYLYLRGMAASNDNLEGVFYTSISADMLATLDGLFASTEQQEATT